MISRRAIIASVIGGAVGLSGCGWIYGRAKLRYRITVVANTPHGLRSGSRIVESTLTAGPETGAASGLTSRIRGTATIVDLGNGARIYALLTNVADGEDYHSRLFHKSLIAGAIASPPMPRIFNSSEWEQERRAASKIKPTIIIPVSLYPTIVDFTNINDVRTVEIINPGRFGGKFGNKFSIKEISISITDDDFTEFDRRNIPNFGPPAQYQEWRRQMRYGDPRGIGMNSFIAGEIK